MPDRISRQEHALRHGPTIGDRVRLGDTDLWIRIEDDLTEPADQVLWGYAKNLRSRMGQHDRATSESELDGKATTTKIKVMQVWLKDGGAWKLLARQAARPSQPA